MDTKDYTTARINNETMSSIAKASGVFHMAFGENLSTEQAIHLACVVVEGLHEVYWKLFTKGLVQKKCDGNIPSTVKRTNDDMYTLKEILDEHTHFYNSFKKEAAKIVDVS